MIRKVIFIDSVHPILADRLAEKGYSVVDGTTLNKEECIESLSDAHGLVIRSRFRMDKSFLYKAKELKFIARSGAGMENIDISYCEEKGIALYNAPEGNRNAVAEHALGMLLSLLNKLHTADKEVRNGKWDRELNRGVELDGKIIGIIGFGNNGSAFAKKLRGFDVTILVYDPYKTGFGNDQIIESSLEQLFDHADVISFHVPQNEETLYYADNAFFNQFKKSIYLLNLSRGKIVKTSALVQAMKSGKVQGAGLDVLEYEKSSFETFFDQEIPEAFQYILNSERTILSPHIGGWTNESYFKLSDVLADKILGEANQ